MMKHKKESYPGEHPAIIDMELWNKVQGRIKSRENESMQRWIYPFLLKGKMKTHEGFLMTPSSSAAKRARYYVSRKAQVNGYASCEIKSLNATAIENLIEAHLFNFLFEKNNDVYRFINNCTDTGVKYHWIRKIIENIVIGPSLIAISLSRAGISITEEESAKYQFVDKDDLLNEPPTVWHQADIREDAEKFVITISIMIRRQHGIRTILSPDGKDLILPAQPKADLSIMQAIGRGFRWREMLDEDPELSVSKFSANCGFGDTYVNKQLLLTGLAPDILHRALSGTLPSAIKLFRLYDAAEFLSWERQREFLSLN